MLNPEIKDEEFLKKPIIIIGSGRSGTTIISEIIFQHELLAWHNNYQEIFTHSTHINYLRRFFDNKAWRLIKFWKFVGFSKNTRQKWGTYLNFVIFNPVELYRFWEYVSGPRIDFSRGFLLNEKVTPEEKKFIRSFLAKQVKYQGRKRLIIKFTGPGRLEYLTSIMPDALIVNVVREPLATIRSWLEVGFWQRMGINKLWWLGAYTLKEEAQAEKLKNDPALITAFQYKKLMETTEYEIKKLGLNVCEVHYEDFVNGPKSFIQKLMTFMELPPSKYVDRYMENISVSNRNTRSSLKSQFSEETKKKIMEIVAPCQSINP
ncbi:MAG: sulfotransferase [Parafilimonas sp.]